MVTKLDKQLFHVFVSFFGLDRAQRSIVFLFCWSRGDHFSHFVRCHWHIDDSSGSGRCYVVLSLNLAIMLNWMHLDVLDIVFNLFCFLIVITIVVIIQWSSICLALMRYLPTGQWRVTVRESDPCTWYSFKKNIWTYLLKWNGYEAQQTSLSCFC